MQVTKKKAVSVKDKLDGNEIDMSMLGLTDVPVKELVMFEISWRNSKLNYTKLLLFCLHFRLRSPVELF